MTEDQKPCKNCRFSLSLWGVGVCMLHEGQPGSQFYRCSDYDSANQVNEIDQNQQKDH